MNKSDLIESASRHGGVSRSAAERVINVVLGDIKRELKRRNSVEISGFGGFRLTKRAARMGRNPRTGEPAKIKAAFVPKFKPYERFMREVN